MILKKQSISILLIFSIFAVIPLSLPAYGGDKGYQGKISMLSDHNYYDALVSGIRKAKKDITGCFFLFKVSEHKGDQPMVIVRELIAARKRGVTVSIELEQAATGKGTVYEQNRKAATMMAEAGIKVRFDVPKTTTHVKAMVIDSRYVYLGSHNLTQSALRYNNELSVMIDSAELAEEVIAYLNNL